MRKPSLGVVSAAVVGLFLAGGAISALTTSDPEEPTAAVAASASTLAFEARFDTPADFYDRFDYGYSGLFIPGVTIDAYHGDHAATAPCGGPTTDRTVHLTGSQFATDFSEAFWWCAPSGDPSSGHLMTGLTTTGYNHLWFAPKAEYTGIGKVCFDINETTEYGKWIELQFVSHADAVRYPVGTITADGNAVARGTGGFDLGYTEPAFRPQATGGDSQVGPNNGLQPQGGTLAGLKVDLGGIFSWWQNQDTMVVPVNNGFAPGWPGPGNAANGGPGVSDKATRYKTCIENVGTSQLLITNARPDGTFTATVDGAHIPQDARRVVFHDAEYDGPKRPGYDPNKITWHWDNIEVYASGSGPEPTTTVPTTPPTTAPPTTQPPTTTPPSTTQAPTTTLPPSTTTTVAPTTTLPPATTTTLPPIPACPSSFNTTERTWCQRVMQHIAALEAKVG